MSQANNQAVQSANTVRLDTHALSTLQYIRASMESATSMAVPGSAGLAMGSVGLIATAISLAPSLKEHWILVWLLAALFAAPAGAILMFRPTSLRGRTLDALPVRRFALCLFPCLFGGAVLTAVLWSQGDTGAIPGTWLLLYGCALVSASALTTVKIAFMGGFFIALGLIALLLSDLLLQMLLLGAGFGGLHVLFGFLLGRADER